MNYRLLNHLNLPIRNQFYIFPTILLNAKKNYEDKGFPENLLTDLCNSLANYMTVHSPTPLILITLVQAWVF